MIWQSEALRKKVTLPLHKSYKTWLSMGICVLVNQILRTSSESGKNPKVSLKCDSLTQSQFHLRRMLPRTKYLIQMRDADQSGRTYSKFPSVAAYHSITVHRSNPFRSFRITHSACQHQCEFSSPSVTECCEHHNLNFHLGTGAFPVHDRLDQFQRMQARRN